MCPNVNCHNDKMNYRCICTERSRVTQTAQRENNTGPLIQRKSQTPYDHIWGFAIYRVCDLLLHRIQHSGRPDPACRP